MVTISFNVGIRSAETGSMSGLASEQKRGLRRLLRETLWTCGRHGGRGRVRYYVAVVIR